MPNSFFYTHSPPPLELILDGLHLDNLAGRLRSFKCKFTTKKRLAVSQKDISKYDKAAREQMNIVHQMVRDYEKRETILQSAEFVKLNATETKALATTEANLKRLKLAYHQAQFDMNIAKDQLEIYDDASSRQFSANLKIGERWTRKHNLPKNMTKPRVLSCKINEGCCSRGCGCCERPRLFLREPIYAHCTTECGCCREYASAI